MARLMNINSFNVTINGQPIKVHNGAQVFFEGGNTATVFLNTPNGHIFAGASDWGMLADIDGFERTILKIVAPKSNRGHGEYDYDGKIIYRLTMITVGGKEYSEGFLKNAILNYEE